MQMFNLHGVVCFTLTVLVLQSMFVSYPRGIPE